MGINPLQLRYLCDKCNKHLVSLRIYSVMYNSEIFQIAHNHNIFIRTPIKEYPDWILMDQS